MDTSTPGYENLGKRHRAYNELLHKALKDETIIKIEDVNFNKNDQENLLIIDVACEKKNLEFVLNILKSEDMMYVSRALQKSTWLFTDNNYAHIINPQYLREQLLPEMTTKAGIKLLKYIRRYLKDEPRVEQFFLSENKTKDAFNWLPNCSNSFIEKYVEENGHAVGTKILKRLCENSIKILEIVQKTNPYYLPSVMNVSFLLTTHTEKFLDILEDTGYSSPKLNAKYTSLLMKKSRDRVIKNFEKYVDKLDIASFAKHLEKKQIKDFLLEQANKDLSDRKYYALRRFLKSPNIEYIIKRIPWQERFDFVNKVFINTDNERDNDPEEDNDEIIPLDSEMYRMRKLALAVESKKYMWYKFAPFDLAFEVITKMIKDEPFGHQKKSMLSTLISFVGKSEENLYTLLQYYTSNYIDYENRHNGFIRKLLNMTQVYKCDKKSWELLNIILKKVDVYVEKEHDVQECIILIILYNTLNDEEIPEIIINKFSFETFKNFRNKLNNKEQEKVFAFLYNYIVGKIQHQNITTETDFIEMSKTLENVMNLLIDWNKELIDYPFVTDKFKNMIKIKVENGWKTSLLNLYNIKKSWKKHMFEESLLLHPSQEVCVNALKHDPGLLLRYKQEVEQICYDDEVSLKLLHSKLRIYWPESLAIDWANGYRERLKILEGHKAVVRGLCALIPENTLIDIIKNYAPKEARINWKEIDEVTLSLQRHIAKNMHLARPQLDPNAVLWYAKGDYLQYALPSLLSVFYNINANLSRIFIPKLLDSPVSVQKHGIRFAFLRLEPTKLNTIFLNIWNSSKNPSIRAELFKHTFKLLCNSKDDAKIDEIWTLLQLFIDNLKHTDDDKLFELLEHIEEVPSRIKANYLVTSYNAYKRQQEHFATDRVYRYKSKMQNLVEYSRILMESIDKTFITDIIQDYLNKTLFNFEGERAIAASDYDGMLKVVSAYLLHTDSLEQQTQLYETVLAPVITRLLEYQSNDYKESNNIENLSKLLFRLYIDLKEYVMDKNIIIPYKMFCSIQEKIESLPVPENYKMLTMWRLATTLTKLLGENDTTCTWDEIIMKIAPDFAKYCRSYLKEEVTSRFSCIYVIFSSVLYKILGIISDEVTGDIYETMLEDKDFVQAFLAVIEILPAKCHRTCSGKYRYNEIHDVIVEHPLVEIKMHYYSKFQKYLA